MKPIFRMLSVAVAATALCAYAQEDEFDDLLGDAGDLDAGEESVADADAGAPEVEDASGGTDTGKLQRQKKVLFYLLPQCGRVDGEAMVKMPGSDEWKPLEESRHYPLGCVFKTLNRTSKVKLMLGPECEVGIAGNSTLGTRAQRVGEKDRAINLVHGIIALKVPASMPEGLLTVDAPGFKVFNPKGESRYRYVTTPDGEEAIVRCVTQTLGIEGLHYKIPEMKVANEVKIVTTEDRLVTILYGNRGDIPVVLDQGSVLVKDYSVPGSPAKEEVRSLDWKLSPRTSVRIHRAKPALGEKLAVATMTFDANGQLKNRCVFVENEPLVNSGELGPTVKISKEELEKTVGGLVDVSGRADDTETQEADAPGDDSGDADGGSSTSGDLDDDMDL